MFPWSNLSQILIGKRNKKWRTRCPLQKYGGKGGITSKYRPRKKIRVFFRELPGFEKTENREQILIRRRSISDAIDGSVSRRRAGIFPITSETGRYDIKLHFWHRFHKRDEC